jgi:hypothetical protein
VRFLLRVCRAARLLALPVAAVVLAAGAGALTGQTGAIPATPIPFDMEAIGDAGPRGTAIMGGYAKAPDGPEGSQGFRVSDQQYGFKLVQPVYAGPDTTVSWSWRKEEGPVCIVQLQLVNPETGAARYFGYGAGAWSEPPSADPTVEMWVSSSPPRTWTTVTRRLLDDVRAVLGWKSAEIREVYLSPWDGRPGDFARMVFHGVFHEDAVGILRARELAALSRIGQGSYAPPRLKAVGEAREDRFDTAFEEAAPGRNSAANEWSAFGAPTGRTDVNCMGRLLRVRYPAFDLIFRMREGEKEIEPGSLDSFRLGLVGGDMPAIRAAWGYGGLNYGVSVMSVTYEGGVYDLYRLSVKNATSQPLRSVLVAGLDGPPDMRLANGVVRGLGAAPFVLVDGTDRSSLETRAWGLCDKRAKSYECGGGPGTTEAAISSTRIGMDGLPVVYRFAARAGEKYVVCIAASPNVSGLLGQPKRAGDLILRYEVEGAAPQTVDWFRAISARAQPIFAQFTGAHDVDGDGFIEVRAGVDPSSKLKHTRLSAIYVFPAGTTVTDPSAVCSGSMNSKCVYHIDVGATPECGWINQQYDTSDVGLCRLVLPFGGLVPPGATRVFTLKVPPIHRRDPASMGTYSHAFREILPGEAVPPFDDRQVERLARRDPVSDSLSTAAWWRAFANRGARIDAPDAVLGDIYRSRVATRAIMDVHIGGEAWFNACSPWFYYDFAFRDQADEVYAYDLAGRHDLAARLLRAYCMEAKEMPPGPIGFAEKPIRPGMLPDGLWNTRPGQFDTQGQNIWCMVEHYKLSGDAAWLRNRAYPYIRRGAQWLVRSRRRHMAQIKDPGDPRYGLIEPGAMEVAAVTRGMHMYYMDAWAVLGLREAADAAAALGRKDDRKLFSREAEELRACLLRSCRATFRRNGLYEGALSPGVEREGDGMYGMWGHTPLLWPTRAFDPNDALLTATLRRMERMSHDWGGGLFSEGKGGCWPYIGVDLAIGYILRGEPEATLDYFCAYTDAAGQTFSWGEGYDTGQNLYAGDQPHGWADAQWINLYRHLYAMEDGGTLLLTPATMRRWIGATRPIAVSGLPTHFGQLALRVSSSDAGRHTEYRFRLDPKGDQARRPLTRVVVSARLPGGRRLKSVRLNGRPIESWFGETVILPRPVRGTWQRLELAAE